jgi:hypothetical protein
MIYDVLNRMVTHIKSHKDQKMDIDDMLHRIGDLIRNIDALLRHLDAVLRGRRVSSTRRSVSSAWWQSSSIKGSLDFQSRYKKSD